MRITQGTFSFLPDLTDEQVDAQVRYALEHAAKGCPELDAALQVWKDVTFDFQSTDTPDYVVTPTVA